MPRQARIDAPGALHHVILRGIERKAIFKGDVDRSDIIERIEHNLLASSTSCYAWGLMTNYVHLSTFNPTRVRAKITSHFIHLSFRPLSRDP